MAYAPTWLREVSIAPRTAPAEIKRGCRYVCADAGGDDSADINSFVDDIITRFETAGGAQSSSVWNRPAVHMVPGLYTAKTSILARRVRLETNGAEFKAHSALAALSGVNRSIFRIEYAGSGDPVDNFVVAGQPVINGNSLLVHGIYANITAQGANFDGKPDPQIMFDGALLYSCGLIGLYGIGSQLRECRFPNLHCWNGDPAGGGYAAVDWSGTDSWFDDISVGSQGTGSAIVSPGVVIRSANNFVTGESWLNRGNGLEVRAADNFVPHFISHDNYGHGVYVSGDRNMIFALTYNNGNAAANTYDGVNAASDGVLIISLGEDHTTSEHAANTQRSVISASSVEGSLLLALAKAGLTDTTNAIRGTPSTSQNWYRGVRSAGGNVGTVPNASAN